jgi:hypothetical protein
MSKFWNPILPGETAWDFVWRSEESRALHAAGAAQQEAADAAAWAAQAAQGQQLTAGEIVALSHDVKVLQAMVSSLAQTMVGAGMVDGAKLGENFQTALQKMFPRPAPAGPPPAPTMPDIPGAIYRGAQPVAPKETAPEATVACAACAKHVPRSKTNITGDGLLCDDCYAAKPV